VEDIEVAMAAILVMDVGWWGWVDVSTLTLGVGQTQRIETEVTGEGPVEV